MDVHSSYEGYWNRLNPDSPEIVMVQQVTPLKEDR